MLQVAEASIRLKAMLTSKGDAFLDADADSTAMFRDYFPEHRAEASVLMASLADGIPGRLRAAPPDMPRPALKANLIKYLCDNRHLTADAATFAVAAWAAALDVDLDAAGGHPGESARENPPGSADNALLDEAHRTVVTMGASIAGVIALMGLVEVVTRSRTDPTAVIVLVLSSVLVLAAIWYLFTHPAPKKPKKRSLSFEEAATDGAFAMLRAPIRTADDARRAIKSGLWGYAVPVVGYTLLPLVMPSLSLWHLLDALVLAICPVGVHFRSRVAACVGVLFFVADAAFLLPLAVFGILGDFHNAGRMAYSLLGAVLAVFAVGARLIVAARGVFASHRVATSESATAAGQGPNRFGVN